MTYDLIIIGAGAAGLFAGATLPSPVNGLILEKKVAPGRKLLMSGAGQCNLTHGGSIKDFIVHYGKNGPQIRSILYQFNNQSVIDFFEHYGIHLFEREDGKVFPKSLQAQDVLTTLVKCCTKNEMQFCYSSSVDQITFENSVFTLKCGKNQYQTRKLIIATGGCSYPITGSDGSFFSVLEAMRIVVNPLSPALVPIYGKEYPYKALSGISFQNAKVEIYSEKGKKMAENSDALLLTHTGFSGPAILNLSRYAHRGDIITMNYYPVKSEEIVQKELSQCIIGNNKQLLTVLYEYFNQRTSESPAEMPKRFLEGLCMRTGIDPNEKASRISSSHLKTIIKLITHDDYPIQQLGGYEVAMVTSGGVPLSDINTKTMESRKYPGIYFAGEVLDIDGDTGGYNLQFAFSSGYLAAQNAI